MPKSLEPQFSYVGGEFSPLLDARVDHPKYSQACRQLQNLIALRQGGATRRPGTVYKASAKYQDTDTYQYATRLMPFQFSPTTSFMLEFGHEYIRFYSNQQQVILSSAPTWVNGDLYVPGDFVEDPSDSDNIYYCIQLNAGLQPEPHSNPLYWVKQDIYEVPTPYNGRQFFGPSIYDVDIWRLVPCQINDVVYIVHPDYPPYKLVRNADTDWTLSKVDFLVPALLDQNTTDTTIAASSTTGSVTLTAAAPAWVTATFYNVGRSVSSGGVIYNCLKPHISAASFSSDNTDGEWEAVNIFDSQHIGSRWQLSQFRDSTFVTKDITANDPTGTPIKVLGSWEVHTYGIWIADILVQRSDDNGNSWTTVRKAAGRADRNVDITGKALTAGLYRVLIQNYAVPGTPGSTTPRVDFEVVNSFLSGVVEITAVASAYSATANVITELYAGTATRYWSEAAWSDYRGYPQAVTAFQQRMVYGGSAYQPQRIWGSVTNDIENFDLGDQTLDTDSFAFELAAVGRGRIQWLLGQIDLAVGFTAAEWIVNAGQGAFGGSTAAVTPTAINAGEHSAWGSSEGVPPYLVGNTILYTQRSAKTLQQMQFSVYTNKYLSADLTSLSEHLFGAGIAQIAYQAQFRNQAMLWVVNKAGGLMGMTHDMQSEIYAWSRHITGWTPPVDGVDQGLHKFESVASIQGQGVQDDEVWVVVHRGNTRMIELMNPNNWETAGTPIKGIAQPDTTLAIYVDSAITATSPSTSTISGLAHLEGMDVIGLLNGNIKFGPYTVTGGEITIDGYDPQLGDILQIGLPIYYSAQTMRLDNDPRGGMIQGVMRAISRLYVRLFNSMGGAVGGNTALTTDIPYRAPGSTPITPPSLFTGQKEVTMQGTQDYDATYIIEGSDPMPLTILATIPRVGISGSA